MEKGYSVAIGDEGGFAPDLKSDEEALELIVDAIEYAGYIPEKDVALALDVAASEWSNGNDYLLPKKNKLMTVDDLFSHYEKLLSNYPILSIEDPFGEEDFPAFARFTARHKNLQIVGDDLFVTNKERLKQGILQKSGNAILIKPNQIGSLSETIETVSIATQSHFNTIISHRSGETEDCFIADLSVALNSGQIKTGAPCRGERLAKYNRLLKIENQLGSRSFYGLFQ